MKKKKVLTYSTSQRGQINVNLNEKNLTFTHTDFQRENTYFPFAISHVYQNNEINKGYGKGFKINLEQTLSKIEGTSKYQLTLADGSIEIFEEIYYYKNSNDERVYKNDSDNSLSRSDITVLQDGTLKYKNYMIHVELRSDTGLSLKSDYKDFIGSDKIDLRNEEIVTLEEEIKQINESIDAAKEDLKYQQEEANKLNDSNYVEMKKAKDDYQKQNQILFNYQMNSYNSPRKKELLEAKNAYNFKLSKNRDNYVGGLVIKGSNLTANEIQYSSLLPRVSFNDISGMRAEYYALKDKYDGDGLKQMTDNAKLADYYSQVFSDEVNELSQKIQDLSNIIENEDWCKQDNLISFQKDVSQAEKEYMDAQENYELSQAQKAIEHYQLLIKRTELQIEKYEILKKSKEFQRDLLYKQIPELFLYSLEGTIYGYNKYGKLCMLFDAYNHRALIEYNDSGQIKHIIDSNNQIIEFIYNGNNQLVRMIDDNNDFIDFVYKSDYLIQFKYSNETQFNLKYSNNMLIEVLDIDNVGYQFEYSSHLLSSLKHVSCINNTYQTDETLNFLYNENLITIASDKHSIQNNYIFDEESSLTTEYSLIHEELDKIHTYEYESDHCEFTMSSNKFDTKLLNVKEIIFSGMKSYEVNTLNSYASDYILYAFAEADSAEEIRNRRVTAYCSHFVGEQNTNCRFELKCLLYYNSHIKEYSVSFNPKIKGKQFAAIPITFEEDSNGQVLIPYRMNVVIQYSENEGQCKITNLSLAQGVYTYCEYNETHHKIYECSSEAISVKNELLEKKGNFIQKKEVEYTYNPKELLEHRISSATFYEYDLNSFLIQKEIKKEKTTYLYNQQNQVAQQFDSKGNVIEYIYNDQGVCIQKKCYHKAMPNMAYIEENKFDEDGKPIASTNELGYDNACQYLNQSPVSITTPNGNILYMHLGQDSVSLSTDIDGIENYNTSIYDKGRLVEYKTEGMKYKYTYDEFGNEKEIYINDKLYCSFAKSETTTTITYKTLFINNFGYEKITDLFGKTLEINIVKDSKRIPYIKYEYDDKERLLKEHYFIHNSEEVLEYIYLEDTLIGIKTLDYTKIQSNDIFGRSKDTIYQMGDTIYKYSNTYDEENRIKESIYCINETNILKEAYTYDSLSRIIEATNPVIKNKYTYVSKNGRTTNLISSDTKSIGNHYLRNQYSYDKEGNIIFKKENHKTSRYTYDKLNRLTREDNEELNQTILYSYDSNGNIQTKEKYDYTLTDNLENKTIIEYNYNDFNDYLTKFNGREIKYDSLGNPVLYKDIPLVWNQRELKKYKDIEFTYNINHIRTKKKTPNKDIEYILDGSTILKEKRMNYTTHLESIIDEGAVIDSYEDEIEYIYSPKGIVGFDYRVGDTKKRYYYNKNILGDILEIYDEDSNLVGKYSYDAYGNHKILLDINSIATINPIRYRSYYYDSETQLYYLNSRYYDPEVCRFISMDSIEYINPDSINGLNLYMYCADNPVMYLDNAGQSPVFIPWFSLSNLFSLTATSIQLIINGGLIYSYFRIANAVRPSNIGLGVWNSSQKEIMESFKSVDVPKLDKASKILAIITIIIQVGEGIYTDYNRGYSTDRILLNTIVNTAVYTATTIGLAKLGALIGSFVPVPVVGTAVGTGIGFLVGVAVNLFLDFEFNNKSIFDHIRDDVYQFWKTMFN